MKSKISTVVPTFNGYPKNKKCIESLLNQSLTPFEIIVVDNASDDDTKNLSKIKGIKYFRLDENTGVTGGRNYGISKVSKKADYVLIFDHDMYADKNMIKKMVELAESDPKIGIVTPKIYYWEDKTRIWSAGTGINLWTGQVLFRGGKDVGQYEQVQEVQVAPACMLVRRKLIDDGLRFDSRYFATFEDTDFCFKAQKRGWKVLYQPQAITWHDLSIDKKLEAKRLLDRAYWVGKNRILFMRDFGKNFLIFLLFIPVYLLYYLKLAIQSNRLKDWGSYFKGTIDGLFSDLSWTKYIPFSYLWILHRAIGKDVKTILD
ncbi:glycosyltransferase family 2 protein, partial [Patescibacteria group bacterium]|nr:glycosyltransferase family 2 protein [Patescibacteria group bacterium]